MEIENEKILALYRKGSQEVKSALKELAGETIFDEISETQQAILAACKEYGFDSAMLPYQKPADEDELSDNAFKILKFIVKCVNKGHVFDWNDANEKKYYPYFYLDSSSGVGLSANGFDYASTITHVGSRLVFRRAAAAADTAKKHLLIYAAFLGMRGVEK